MPETRDVTEIDSDLRLNVTPQAPKLRRLKFGLYTFDRRVVAERHLSRMTDERRVRLRLRFRLRSGRYTLYAEGHPNAAKHCGPKHTSRVVRFGGGRGGSKPDKEKAPREDAGDDDDGGEAPAPLSIPGAGALYRGY